MTDPAAYDPPTDLEGPNMGLIEAIADRLWSRRTRYTRRPGEKFSKQSAQVHKDWRESAADVFAFLQGIGFVGPSGEPSKVGLTYSWLYEAHEWEIRDGAKGFVALVREEADVPLILAAPKMAQAIRALLERLEGDPCLDMPELRALAESTAGLERLTFDVEEPPAPSVINWLETETDDHR